MSRQPFVLLLAVALLAGASDRSAAQQTAPAGDANPFDGQWSLQVSFATGPGGASYPGVSTFNCLYAGENRQFEVKADGTFEWLAREAGTQHDDGISANSSFQNDFQLHLRGRGKAERAPRTGGPERPGDRRLSLQLSFIGGDGRGSAVNMLGSGFSIGVVSADLMQMTFTSYPGGNVITVATVPHEVTWPALTSASTTREETSPDVIVETTTYQANRQGTLRVGPGQEVSVTERIEVKHVRYLNLVPRG
jgi:hypothetical protein